MKKLMVVFLLVSLGASAQSAYKLTADSIAQYAFSRSKSKSAEKYGVSKARAKSIISTVVSAGYAGTYDLPDGQLKLIITGLNATLWENGQSYPLKNVIIRDGYFQGTSPKETLKGAFLQETEDGTARLGLGLLFASPRSFSGQTTSKIFLAKKV